MLATRAVEEKLFALVPRTETFGEEVGVPVGINGL